MLVKDLAMSLSTTNLLLTATKNGGLLASGFKCKQYYRENFKVVDPVEYAFEDKGNRTLNTFQYWSLYRIYFVKMTCLTEWLKVTLLNS